MKNENIFKVTPINIWNYKQNHPELIINDLKNEGFTEEQINIVRISMLARGVNKWLKVRRDLIAYKKLLKHEIKQLMDDVGKLKINMTNKWCNFNNASVYDVHEYNKAREQYVIARELLKYKQKVRSDLKKLCMTNRWQIWEGKHLSDMNTITASDN